MDQNLKSTRKASSGLQPTKPQGKTVGRNQVLRTSAVSTDKDSRMGSSTAAGTASPGSQNAMAPLITSHLPFLSQSQISKAQQAFQHYLELSVKHSASPSPQTAADSSNLQEDDYRAQPMTGLSARGVQQFLSDIGITKTEAEAKDIIFTLQQSHSVTQRNDAAALSSASSADDQPPRAASPTSTLTSATLPFHAFLELLLTCPDEGAATSCESELTNCFRVMDCDGDGVLSGDDVHRVVERIAADIDCGTMPMQRDIAALQLMDPDLLAELIAEADLDGDDRVTLSDFIAALTTA